MVLGGDLALLGATDSGVQHQDVDPTLGVRVGEGANGLEVGGVEVGDGVRALRGLGSPLGGERPARGRRLAPTAGL